jgi:predicted nucleic acid-binding protein
MPSVLLDTSIYIATLRSDDEADFVLRKYAAYLIWLSAVVLQELYAGAASDQIRKVERLEHDFDKARRILVPSVNDWIDTGRLLAKVAAKYQYEEIGRSRLTNDALIAMSARRLGITLVTVNERDFARIAAVRAFNYEVLSKQERGRQ